MFDGSDLADCPSLPIGGHPRPEALLTLTLLHHKCHAEAESVIHAHAGYSQLTSVGRLTGAERGRFFRFRSFEDSSSSEG